MELPRQAQNKHKAPDTWMTERGKKGELEEKMRTEARSWRDAMWLSLKMEKGVTNPKMVDSLLEQKESKGVEMVLFLPVF